ncbi:MAG: hypothetical protein M3042_07990 [Actinomycetota bacterium]|nr:hypothetical protein [Actinomycetota bacterium]
MPAAARVALVTCAQFPDLDEDGPALLAALRDQAVDPRPAVWDDSAVDWAAFDLAVIRSPWDYAPRREEFVAWAESVPRLANPAAVVRWNTDKRYLTDLSARGIPVVPTTFLAPGDSIALPESGEFVVKPAVGAGALDTARYRPDERARAGEHVRRLHGAGRTAMVQPYLARVDVAGETALLYTGGHYSHTIRKDALLTGPAGEVEGLYREESISAREPAPAQVALAEAALAAVPGSGGQLLYARVDLLPGPDGAPVLLELELTEPSLFLGLGTRAIEQFAAAIAAAVPR